MSLPDHYSGLEFRTAQLYTTELLTIARLIGEIAGSEGVATQYSYHLGGLRP
jgi:hypothetical protein